MRKYYRRIDGTVRRTSGSRGWVREVVGSVSKKWLFNLEIGLWILFVSKNMFLFLRSWSLKLAKNFASCGMLIIPVQMDALPGQQTTPTDVASHLYKHSQIATPPPVPGKPHKQMLATPLYNKCTLHTHPPFLFLCLFHLRDTPSLPIIRAKLLQPSPWLYILTPLFPLERTLLRCSLSFVQRLLDTQEPSYSHQT